MQLEAAKALDPRWLSVYKESIHVLHLQIAEVRCWVYVLRQIRSFPWSVFGEGSSLFWSLTDSALGNAIVISLWRILYDTDENALTLRKLKNGVIRNIRNEAAGIEIRKELREAEFEKEITGCAERLEYMRHNYIAHQSLAAVRPGAPPAKPVSLAELESLLEAATGLINIISFDDEFVTWPPEYDPQFGTRTDIEMMLDGIAERHRWLREPENNPESFRRAWASWHPVDRAGFNKYRQKFGKPEIAVPAEGVGR